MGFLVNEDGDNLSESGFAEFRNFQNVFLNQTIKEF